MTSPAQQPQQPDENRGAGPPEQQDLSAESLAAGSDDDTMLEPPNQFDVVSKRCVKLTVEQAGDLVLAIDTQNRSFYPKDPPSRDEFRALWEGPGLRRVEDIVHLPSLVNGVPPTVYFMSDLHGTYRGLRRLFLEQDLGQRLRSDETVRPAVLVLGGDLIDRSSNGSGLLEILYSMQLDPLYRDSIVIFPGNHERYRNIQKHEKFGGFYEELMTRHFPEPKDEVGISKFAAYLKEFRGIDVGKQAEPEKLMKLFREELWNLYNDNFNHQPRLAIADNGAVFMHGGITNKGIFASVGSDPAPGTAVIADRIDALMSLGTAWRRELGDPMLEDILWSDYTPNIRRIASNDRGSDAAGKRIAGPGLAYGPAALESWLTMLGQSVLVRGHQSVAPEGVELLGGRDRGAWRHERIITAASAEVALAVNLGERLESAQDAELISLG